MIEVEAKIKIGNPAGFRKKARKLGKLVGKKKKVDDYYTLESLAHYPKKSLRIRKEGGKNIVNFKRKLSYVKGVHAKDEREFIVENVEDFLQLIKDFGFKKWLRKEKISEIYKVKNNFHIELNHLKNLGWFAEIEYLVEEKEVVMARKEVLDLIKKLGLSGAKVIKDGYTKMLWDKRK